MSDLIEPDPWTSWRQFTNARIALGRTGHALPTAPWLAFNLAHAQARDAVHHPLDVPALEAVLREHGHEVVTVSSAAPDRAHYLRRPDLGRRLSDESRALIGAVAAGTTVEAPPPELVFVIADGLSATAAAKQAAPVLDAVLPRLDGWTIGPIVIATQARVALGDEVGELLHARFVVMLIGERPGLSSPDSLGLYLTHAPRVGCRDAQRNCISNVRPEGLSFAAAAYKLHHLLTQARRLGLTGVGLKDESGPFLDDRT
ncbi:ethanolamine ammonia-lyase [Roseateles aquatilis]|uniref:Ethanolamine ammonia-lyase small subunit n=1 Tax=Roseateles aquatilis TaxID=431061 RepID=A0A246IZ89_9BURK|nr:ethanolamine ammonia-lyase subunit EutC [Roseateles aquatilis]OWQ85663.1 ethanolamine ammonia-lyase [Roseateles aquatilis]